MPAQPVPFQIRQCADQTYGKSWNMAKGISMRMIQKKNGTYAVYAGRLKTGGTICLQKKQKEW